MKRSSKSTLFPSPNYSDGSNWRLKSGSRMSRWGGIKRRASKNRGKRRLNRKIRGSRRDSSSMMRRKPSSWNSKKRKKRRMGKMMPTRLMAKRTRKALCLSSILRPSTRPSMRNTTPSTSLKRSKTTSTMTSTFQFLRILLKNDHTARRTQAWTLTNQSS